MKKWILIITLFVFVTMPIVLSPNKEDFIRDMVASHSGEYSVYLFWENQSLDPQRDPHGQWDQLLGELAMNRLPISRFSAIDLNEHESEYDYRKLLDISRVPVFLLLDHQKILLRTEDPWQILDYLKDRMQP